jgi:hypothetical protein
MKTSKLKKRMSSGSRLTSKLYDKIIKILSKSHESITLKKEGLAKKRVGGEEYKYLRLLDNCLHRFPSSQKFLPNFHGRRSEEG